jgi:hypothetical protein
LARSPEELLADIDGSVSDILFHLRRRKFADEMVAELLREIGVLTIVFVPLDLLFAMFEFPGRSIPWRGVSWAIGLGISSIVIGMWMERSAK